MCFYWWRAGVTTAMKRLLRESDREVRALLVLSVGSFGEGRVGEQPEGESI
jgi:hypothetical protein